MKTETNPLLCRVSIPQRTINALYRLSCVVLSYALSESTLFLTWYTGRFAQTYKLARLDRALCSDNWRLRFQDAWVSHLSAPHSDHPPLLISLGEQSGPAPLNRPSRFQATWMLHENFTPFLHSYWRPDFVLFESLHLLISMLTTCQIGIERFWRYFQKEEVFVGLS